METRDVSALLGQLDLAFVIDATGSMGLYIEEARRHARDVAADFAKSADLDIRCAVVFYRDHPPQDASFVTDVRPFGPMNGLVLKLRQDANGGGDTPEAVWDGVFAAATGLSWRPNADKRVFLIGDSPPHGVGYTGPSVGVGGSVMGGDAGVDAAGLLTLGDGFPDGCPCGLSGGGLSELLVSKGIVLHAHSIVGMKETTDAFRALAEATGGECTVVDRPEASTVAYAHTLRDTSNIISDARLYATVALANDPSETWSLSRAKDVLGWSSERVARASEYLSGRGYDFGLRTEGFKPEDAITSERGRDG